MHRAMSALGSQRRGERIRRVSSPYASSDSAFDDLTRLAARCCGTPAAAIALVDDGGLSFRSRIGMLALHTPRVWPFCSQTLAHRDLIVASDATGDADILLDVPDLEGHPPIRFYACAPLITPAGEAIGTLCVLDSVPRTLTPEQQEDLRILSHQVTAQVELRQRTSEMSQQDELLRTIVDSEPQCVKVLGLDGSVRLMNRAGLAMLGVTSFDEIANRHVLTFVAEESREAFQAMLDRVSHGHAASLDFQTAGPPESRRWLEMHAVPLRDEQAEVSAVLGITHDVTDQRRALADLRDSEKKFRTLFEEATDSIFLTDLQARILNVNGAACALTGYTRDELTAMNVAEIVFAADIPRIAAEIARLAGGQAMKSEWQLRRKDGTPATIEVTSRLLPDGQIQAFARDVTERRVADLALRESKSRLQEAVRAGGVGLWDWDLLTSTVSYSSEWKQQFGYQDHEISESLDEWLTRIHPDDAGWLRERVHEFVNGDARDFEVQFRFRHKKGHYRQVLAHGSKIVDAHGRAVRVLGSNIDVTERHDLQAQFLQAQKMESVGRLAGGIAHDFNNLLTVINGMADLAIMAVDEDAPIRSELNEIRLAGDRAARLTRQLLALSRQQILKPEVLNLASVVAQMQSMLQRLLGEDVELGMNLPADLASIKADPGQIEQVILNLAINARDAMPDGGTLTIETRHVDLDAAFAASHPSVVPGPHVLLEVTDTGIGMDEATRDRIFEPFFTTKAPGKGTGLGLPTIYGIVKQSGGSVWVASEPGMGTTFSIYLPQVADRPQHGRAAVSTAPASGTETILLVEDERPLREFTRRILQSAGYTVLQAGNGNEALALIESADALDLMVTDVVMPGMNGRELSTRAASLRPDIKTLYMSGYTDDAILRHGVLDDAARFIMKPFTQAELKGKVREVLDG